MSLTTRAVTLHQCKRNAAKWVLAVWYLRRRNLWVLESGAAKRWAGHVKKGAKDETS